MELFSRCNNHADSPLVQHLHRKGRRLTASNPVQSAPVREMMSAILRDLLFASNGHCSAKLRFPVNRPQCLYLLGSPRDLRGAGTRIRTEDRRFTKPLLYH